MDGELLSFFQFAHLVEISIWLQRGKIKFVELLILERKENFQ